jgi:hypothetical protein
LTLAEERGILLCVGRFPYVFLERTAALNEALREFNEADAE